jgi:hypothetical protein
MRFSTISAPGSPAAGDLYSDGNTLYFHDGSAWKDLTEDTGATAFLGLTDTPAAYTGAAGYAVRVNATPDGLEYVAPAALFTGVFTQGSLTFAAADGSLEEDNANLFWDDTSNYLGIGTNSPARPLHVDGAMRLASLGSAPSSPAAGDLYSDGTNIYFYNGSSWDDLTSTGSSSSNQLIQDFTVETGQSIAAGDVVSFLDGTIRKGETSGGTSETVYNSASTSYNSIDALDAANVVVAYRDVGNTDQGTAVIGEISGSSISYGSEYVFDTGIVSYVDVAMLDSTHFVVVYQDESNSNYGTAVIGTVSGTTISYGSEYVFNSGETLEMSVTVLDSTHFAVSYRDVADGNDGYAIVGTVSGSTISYGTEAEFNSNSTYYTSIDALDSTHVIITYRDGVDSDGWSIIGTVSGSTISYGSQYEFNDADTTITSVTAFNASKVIVAYNNVGDSDNGYAIVGTVSGSTISYGSAAIFNNGNTRNYISIDAKGPSDFVISYQDEDNSNYGTRVTGTVDGTTISYDPETVYNTANTQYIDVVGIDSDLFVTTYTDVGNSSYGTCYLYQDDIVNYVGIAKNACSSGSSCSVIIGGVADSFSGLTTGTIYYADLSGAITTDVTDYRIGIAISSTEILLGSNRNNIEQFF